MYNWKKTPGSCLRDYEEFISMFSYIYFSKYYNYSKLMNVPSSTIRPAI